MWRAANLTDDADIVEMSRELYTEDPAPLPVPEEHTRRTLVALRAEPVRGTALVLEVENRIAGYAFVISFWSNELGGEVLVVDELFVRRPFRNRGHGRALLADLTGETSLWPRAVVAVELEVTPENRRAGALYAQVGFRPVKNTRLRFVRPS